MADDNTHGAQPPEQGNEASFSRNATSVFVTSAALIPLGLASSIVLTRFLTVADRGIFFVAAAIASVAVLLSSMGWPVASIYRIRRVHTEPARVATAGLIAIAGVSTLAVPVYVAIEPLLTRHFLHGAPPLVFFLAVAAVPFHLLSLVFQGIARAIDRFDLQNAFRFLQRLGSLVAVSVVLVVAGGGVVGALAAVLAIEVVFAFALVRFVVRLTGLARGIDFAQMRDNLSFGLKSQAQGVAGQVHEKVDLFMIAYFLADPDQVAYYGVAASTVTLLKMIPDSIGVALLPQIAGYEQERAAAFTARVSRHSLLWVVAFVAVLGLSGPFLIPLVYGKPYAPSVAPFLLLLPGMGLLTIYRILARYFTALGRQRINVVTQIASTTVNILLNLWLIPRYGILGAASASLASYGLEAVLIVGAFRRDSGQRIRDALLFRSEDLAFYRRRLDPVLARILRSG